MKKSIVQLAFKTHFSADSEHSQKPISGTRHTMYDFHDSTDTLKFWTEKRAINKTFFVFHLILMKFCEIVVHMSNYNFNKFHQNQMKNKNFFINRPFFCAEFQSVNRIVKIVHSASLILCYNLA